MIVYPTYNHVSTLTRMLNHCIAPIHSSKLVSRLHIIETYYFLILFESYLYYYSVCTVDPFVTYRLEKLHKLVYTYILYIDGNTGWYSPSSEWSLAYAAIFSDRIVLPCLASWLSHVKSVLCPFKNATCKNFSLKMSTLPTLINRM